MTEAAPTGPRRCTFDKCKALATARGYWPEIDLTAWYCRPHLYLVMRVNHVREVVSRSGTHVG